MSQRIRRPSKIKGVIVPPGDKSISQRAVLLNSIAFGEATISNYSTGQDATSMIQGLKRLGANICLSQQDNDPDKQPTLIINGNGPESLKEPTQILDAGNSGTALRLLAGLMAAQPFFGIITGDQSLKSRPMTRVVEPLSQMGATIIGRDNNSLAPLAIRGGNLKGIEYKLKVASSQVKSSILIAGLFANEETSIIQPAVSRDHTERMLNLMGAHLQIDGLRVSIKKSNLTALDIKVPGDISAATFWIVAACCHPNAHIRIQSVGVNPTRTGVLDVLKAMGAKITLEEMRENAGEPIADLVAESSDLVGTEIYGDMIPRVIDELPVLALAACFAKGTTVIKDASELRVKESDRIRSTVKGLSNIGANIEELPDGMRIHGITKLTGSRCHSEGDHRIAMTMGIAGLLADGEMTVEGTDAANISYPEFWEILAFLSQSNRDKI